MYDGFERLVVSADGVEISCVKAGSGPPVLLLHGFPQTKAMWAHVAPALARDFTVIAADLRGYGDSAKPRAGADCANYSFRAMASDQLALMRHFGFERFHGVGHDRGGRVLHRMALDNPDVLCSLTVMDIVPTYAMFMDTNRHVAGAYWHWYFLAQPGGLPETLIAKDPDAFFETCLVGWGAARLNDFDPELMADYRRAWRHPGMIHGSCADYRAAAAVDLALDEADLDRKVSCPALVFYGSGGVMAGLFDIPAEWRKRCAQFEEASLPGGHFFVDQYPAETASILREFLRRNAG